jgi:hypothetical protein
MLYFAYGSNLSKAHMRRRCPDAVPLGELFLPNTRLIFRGVADCVEEAGARCPGGVYRITSACERRLDQYEGVGGGFYSKVILPIDGVPGEEALMYYVMNSTGIMPPTVRYLDTIRAGYRDFKLPLKLLRDAVAQAWDDKDKTFAERCRRHRDGHAPLASSKSIVLPTRKPTTTGKAATGQRAAASRSKSK